VSKATELDRPLSPGLVQAAHLDAQGKSVNEIALAVGLSRQTVSSARNADPRYLAERRAAMSEAIKPLTEVMEQVREESLSAARKAIQRLIEHLDANIEGIPDNAAQREAAKILLNSPVIRHLFGVEQDMNKTVTNVNAVQIVFRDSDGGTKVVDILEGDATEVLEDEDV
jgi:hypothetical protein